MTSALRAYLSYDSRSVHIAHIRLCTTRHERRVVCSSRLSAEPLGDRVRARDLCCADTAADVLHAVRQLEHGLPTQHLGRMLPAGTDDVHAEDC